MLAEGAANEAWFAAAPASNLGVGGDGSGGDGGGCEVVCVATVCVSVCVLSYLCLRVPTNLPSAFSPP